MSGADRPVRRTDYSKEFHVYGLEWTEDYIYTYLDKPSFQTLYWKFDSKKTMWDRGGFGYRIENSSMLQNPWAKSTNTNAPFDESFYLILNLAVGSQTGYFP
jgi:beta-glucanase (GH16 family)